MARKRSSTLAVNSLDFFKERLGDLVSGLVFWFPIGVLFLVGSYIYTSLEDLGDRFLAFFISDEYIFPGFGILVWIAIFLLTGILMKHTSIGDLLSGFPVIGILFRKKGGRIISVTKLLGLTPCLFLFSPTCPSYGWILSEETVRISGEQATFQLLNVYYPNVPSIVTGQIFPVRKEAAIRLGNPSREVIDLLLYALRSPESIRYLPWEGETAPEFQARAERFGLNLAPDSVVT